MKFSFRPYKSGKPSSEDASPSDAASPQQKRKDQIRRAQKTHRERKEAYVKALEVEVVQLRANEARILQETRSLYATITDLKRRLVDNGIQFPSATVVIPSEVARGEEKEERSITLQIQEMERKKGKQIGVQRHPADHNRHRPSGPSIVNTAADTSHRSPRSNYSHPFSASTVSPSTAPPSATNFSPLASHTRVGDLDLSTIGMEFVLRLESPCFPHMFAATDTSTTGHALCVSASVLHHHPHQALIPQKSADGSTWQVPALSIERLLELSNSVPLQDGELTPVQVWDAVRRHEGLWELETERLERLKERLVKEVKCYGFGGVIDQVIVNDALFEAFIVGRVF
ncbi:hypothetical protein FB567DRAFT_218998 [Paraphoma chrysanthemicola]|uniref:BZIP domain-containing protein n=1 Tax=Paraphoma chrysanthemicola TaxID=798071 RepID=A0A8K0VST7_9PLEO|nr:hypothetical protein FB567DRAFT_218998 [Paraphoma chrysanthemicola]